MIRPHLLDHVLRAAARRAVPVGGGAAERRTDARARAGLQGDMLKDRQEKYRAFEEFLKVKEDEYKAMRPARIDLRGGAESDNESVFTLVEDVDEVELSYKEEIIDYGGPRDSD